MPEALTDGGMAVIGPDHEVLAIRWGGFPWNGGDDWQVRARLGSGFVGGFTAWKYDGMHSFAGIHEDGTISIFRSTVLDVWKEDTLAPTGPRIVDVPIAWTSLRAENLAAPPNVPQSSSSSRIAREKSGRRPTSRRSTAKGPSAAPRVTSCRTRSTPKKCSSH